MKKMYSEIYKDSFPPKIKITYDFVDKPQELIYEKVEWNINGQIKGLRYGDNPEQQAAMYKLINGNLLLGDIITINPGMNLITEPCMEKFGKHPGKTNLTDVDNALNILRYLSDKPTCTIMKHNNPCGVSQAETITEAYLNANNADRIAAFGGAIVLNRSVDINTAKEISERYAEVIAAPEYEEGSIDILSKRKNLRIMKISNIDRLCNWVGKQYINFKSLIDGGLILETAFVPKLALDPFSFTLAETKYKNENYKINRTPTEKELEDMRFGWLVESGVSSNSVLFIKNKTTVSIGTGEQDRVGAVELAIIKAYTKFRDSICFKETKISYADLEQKIKLGENLESLKEKFNEQTKSNCGGLKNSVMISDGFFPFRDSIDIASKELITGIIQPGGSERDFEVINACNESNITMVYTNQRSFKH